MPRYIPKPPTPLQPATANDPLLPEFLQLKQKVTYEHDGQYYQGYIGQREGIYRFFYKRHANCKDEEWGVPLPDLTHHWSSLCVEGILFPEHNVSSFL